MCLLTLCYLIAYQYGNCSYTIIKYWMCMGMYTDMSEKYNVQYLKASIKVLWFLSFLESAKRFYRFDLFGHLTTN
jgi:hypothetical protein